MEEINLEYIQKNGLIIYDVIYGSHAYGTNRPDSDIDKRGIYVLPDSLLKSVETVDGFTDNLYYSEINDGTQNIVYYELRKFLYMLSNSKPNVFEILNTPDDCVLYKHPVMDLILSQKDDFLNKKCYYTFTDYVKKQLDKASGLNKMQHWDSEKMKRKTPIDFCYALIGGQSKSLLQHLEENRMDAKFCGISNIPHAKDMYALFYDLSGAQCFSSLYDETYRNNQLSWRKKKGFEMGKGYKGVQMDDSNMIRLSAIPKFETMAFHVFYNKDGYSMHCKDYLKYQDWLTKRNESRYTDFNSHGQGLDGKNMLHCRRIFEMCEEIALGKGVIVRRENAKELLKIRTGDVSLQKLKDYAESNIPNIKVLFDNSNLPDDINIDVINSLLLNVRLQFNKGYVNNKNTSLFFNSPFKLREIY